MCLKDRYGSPLLLLMSTLVILQRCSFNVTELAIVISHIHTWCFLRIVCLTKLVKSIWYCCTMFILLQKLTSPEHTFQTTQMLLYYISLNVCSWLQTRNTSERITCVPSRKQASTAFLPFVIFKFYSFYNVLY